MKHCFTIDFKGASLQGKKSIRRNINLPGLLLMTFDRPVLALLDAFNVDFVYKGWFQEPPHTRGKSKDLHFLYKYKHFSEEKNLKIKLYSSQVYNTYGMLFCIFCCLGYTNV